MKPSDLGLPSSFTAFRLGQLDWALEAGLGPYRSNLLLIPTGGGKSLAYMAAAALYREANPGARVAILTSSRGLQDQISREFAGMGVVDVRGRGNYECGEYGGTCDDGPCMQGESCILMAKGCEYFDAVRRAAEAQVVVTNYAFFLHSLKSESIGRFDLVICDEAHDLEEWVRGHGSVSVKPEQLEWMAGATGIEMPEYGKDNLEAWRRWVGEVKGMAAAAPVPRPMLRAVEEAGKFVGVRRDGWWWEADSGRGLRAVPLAIGPYVAGMLGGVKRVILSSATLTEGMAGGWGLGELGVVEADSPFPLASRPVHLMTDAPLINHRSTENELMVWARKIDRVIAERPGRRGIIHTVSYSRAQYLARMTEHRDRVILCGSGRGTRDGVEVFKRREGAVLLSPALTTGWDFPGELCRFQVMAKLPYPDARDPREKAVFDADKGLASRLVATQLVQAYGRGVRSKEDWCEMFLMDGNFSWFIRNHKKLLPKWFLLAVQRQQRIPKPLGG